MHQNKSLRYALAALVMFLTLFAWGVYFVPMGRYLSVAFPGDPNVTGFAYGADVANEVQFRLELGIAISNETTDQLLAQLRVERQQLDAKKPLPPPVVGLSNGENPR
jgi:hypothetical protein